MSYGYPGEGSLDYFPCQYGTSKLIFRGPRRDLAGNYCVALGGTETYGKFVPLAFPTALERQLGMPVVNLGCVNAGPDVYLNDPVVLEIASQARAVVIQITGAQNLSNRFYAVHPRRNDRFLSATPLLRSMYREVDFTQFNFTRHMLQGLHRAGPKRFEVLAQELCSTWVTRMTSLLRRIPSCKVLLWLADQPPSASASDPDPMLNPVLIHAGMIQSLLPYASAYHEHVISPAAKRAGTQGMSFAPFDAPAAAGVPNPAVHQEVADALFSVLDGVLLG